MAAATPGPLIKKGEGKINAKKGESFLRRWLEERGGGGVRREKHVFTTITRALLSKNKNRKKLLSLRSRPGRRPPRNVNANLVKILVSPPQLSSGGRGSRGRRRSRSRDTSIATRLGAALPPLTAPGVQTHNHTPQNQPFPLGPHAPTSGLGSLETVLEA